MTDVSLGMPQLPAPAYPDDVRARLEADARHVIGRYPDSRSALLPLLHLVQSEEGYVSRTGTRFCAEVLGLTTAEVAAVATFYTMYRRKPSGDYQVGVCTNTLCAVMGGDAIFDELKTYLGVGNNETTGDGKVTLEHIECNAACDYAPVVMVNWEFFDNQTPESAKQLVDDLRAGRPVEPTRGAPLCGYQETARILAGFPDERPGAVEASGGAGHASLIGLKLARGEMPGQPRVVAPRTEPHDASPSGSRTGTDPEAGAETGSETGADTGSEAGSGSAAGARPGSEAGSGSEAGAQHLSSHDAPQQTSASDPAAAPEQHPAGPASEEGE